MRNTKGCLKILLLTVTFCKILPYNIKTFTIMDISKHKKQVERIKKKFSIEIEYIEEKEKDILDFEKNRGYSFIKRKEYILLVQQLIQDHG